MPVRHHGSRRGRVDLFSMELMTKPQSNAGKIVFPWDPLMKTFNKNDYAPTIYGDHVTNQDITEFFSSLEKCPNYQLYNPCCLIILIPIIMLLGFGIMIALILIGANQTSKRTSSGPSIFFFAPILFMPILMAAVITISCCVQKKSMDSLKMRQTQF
jgi:hypothetical protein